MGCTQSKIENEEAVVRCKNRKINMKDAVAFRNAFAAAHSSYAMSLKNTGAALSDFAHAELPSHHLPAGSSSSASVPTIPSSSSSAAPVPPVVPDSQLPPPPPPLPPLSDFQPLQRAASMPEIKIQKQEKGRPAGPAINEEDEMESEPQDNEKLRRKRGSSNRGTSGGAGGSNRGGTEGPSQHQQRRREEEAEAIGSQPAASTVHTVAQQDTAWDFFFPPVESMPGSTLADPVGVKEEVRVNKEEIFEEKSRRVEEEDVEKQQPEPVVVEKEKVEKTVEVPVPVAAPAKKPVKKTGGEGGGKRVVKANLIQIFAELDDHFLKASESAHEVSKMLEATRLHYHSNFADNRGHIDHSARVMRVITWNRSFKGLPNVDDGKDDFDSEENETHATVLDKMLAWEKKLYDEVKEGELMKIEYQKKVASLNKHKKRGTNPESLEKLKAAVSHLHTRYIVDMQSLDSTVMEINRLRDKQLYPKLVELVKGMATMWETMQGHHDTQSKLADRLKTIGNSPSLKETSEHHHDRTYQLYAVVQEWHSQFCKLIDNQKAYIKALNDWLKLNLIPIESSLKEKVSSPPRVENPPIQRLIVAWYGELDKIPDEVARAAINNFAAVIQTIMQLQEEEMKLKEKCEDTQKELNRRRRQFDDWCQKYMQQRTAEELDPERPENDTVKEAIAERRFVVDQLQKQLEDDEEAYRKQCVHVREKSLNSLKSLLPELFRAMSDVSLAFSQMYGKLRSMSSHRNPRSTST